MVNNDGQEWLIMMVKLLINGKRWGWPVMWTFITPIFTSQTLSKLFAFSALELFPWQFSIPLFCWIGLIWSIFDEFFNLVIIEKLGATWDGIFDCGTIHTTRSTWVCSFGAHVTTAATWTDLVVVHDDVWLHQLGGIPTTLAGIVVWGDDQVPYPFMAGIGRQRTELMPKDLLRRSKIFQLNAILGAPSCIL